MATTTTINTVAALTLRPSTTTSPSGLDNLLREIHLSTPFPYFEDADVLRKPLDIGRAYFADILSQLTCTDHENAFKAIQWPNNLDNGDLIAILPKLVLGTDADNVDALALTLVHKFPTCALFVRPFSIPGEVQLRVFFNSETLSRLVLPYALDRGSSYGTNASLGHRDSSNKANRKRVLIEFSSPNITDDFHGKHLRSTVLGSQLAHIYEATGWDVVRLNYLGDWGKPMALLGIGWHRFGKDEEFQKRPIRHILETNHRIHALFEPELVAWKKARDAKRPEEQTAIESQGLFAERNSYFARLEQGDSEAIAFWQKIRDASVSNYAKLYNRLNIKFDVYSGESQLKMETMDEVEGILLSSGIAEENLGSIVIDMKEKAGMKAGMSIIRDRAGGRTYLLRELAAVLERHREFDFDEMLYVVASDHNDHFIRVKRILELMGMSQLAGKLRHVSFSKVSNVNEQLNSANTLRAILDRCTSAVRMSLDYHVDIAAVLGKSDTSVAELATNALLAEEVHLRRATDDNFDESRLTSFESGTALHLQLTRAKLIMRLRNDSSPDQVGVEEHPPLRNPDQIALLRLVVMWPDVSHAAFVSLEPTGIVHFLSTMTCHLSASLDNEVDFNQAEKTLHEVVKIVLDSGMSLLGMKTFGA